MIYMYKQDLNKAASYVVVPANSETLDFELCRQVTLALDTVGGLTNAVRRVFCLGHQDEVSLQFEGVWDSEVVDGKVQHPFLRNKRVPVPVSR